MTLSEFRSALKDTLQDFYSNSELDQLAKSLLMSRMNLNSTAYLLASESELSDEVLEQLKSDVHRLSMHEPLQYVLGNTSFYGLEIQCNPAALIPRPETEELVDWVLSEVQLPSCALIDLGTGTGCIPLAIKAKRPSWQVSAIDVSEDALALARTNALSLALDVHFEAADLLKDFSDLAIKDNFNVVISNPPYIPNADAMSMLPNVLNHEPHLALFVPDSDPLLFYRRIVAFSEQYLEKEGYVFVEIHEDLSEETIQLFHQAGFANIELRKDLQGKPRMIKAQRVSL
ncbi:MAG: peptide chain release factor N(5)-glutamine methyltransferase [Flavobacteriales bacterium]|jgi:release factor glutamine methyltransferase